MTQFHCQCQNTISPKPKMKNAASHLLLEIVMANMMNDWPEPLLCGICPDPAIGTFFWCSARVSGNSAKFSPWENIENVENIYCLALSARHAPYVLHSALWYVITYFGTFHFHYCSFYSCTFWTSSSLSGRLYFTVTFQIGLQVWCGKSCKNVLLPKLKLFSPYNKEHNSIVD